MQQYITKLWNPIMDDSYGSLHDNEYLMNAYVIH